MRTEEEIICKINQLQEYLRGRTKPVLESYSLEQTRAFISGLEYALNMDEDKEVGGVRK